jgi:hypothetical protein
VSQFYDPQDGSLPRATVTVHTDTPEAKVTYRGPNGAKFSAIFRQKLNPIGFHARLPGDRKR